MGNLNRIFLSFEKDKWYFERYWLGEGDLDLTSDEFNQIYNQTLNNGKIEDCQNIEYNGNQAKQCACRIKSGEYFKSIGWYTLYTDLSDNPIGLYDYYNFDWHLGLLIPIDFNGDKVIYDNLLTTVAGCTDRTFISEWSTRAVSIASLLSNAKPYKIKY